MTRPALMIVTQYAGTETVKVYATAGGTDLAGSVGSDGRIDTTPENAEDDVFVTLKSVGRYYLAGTAADRNGLATTDDEVGVEAGSAQVYSYVNASDETVYVVLGSTTVAGDTTTIVYEHVDIHIDLDRDGDGTADDVEVTAKIPEATDYEHIHFGVWAALGAAEKDGSQTIADLGIGFLQNYSGEGMTGADMPNNGSGLYKGNWVATVRAEDEDGNGPIALTNGAATVKADFGKGDITATLTGLAELSGEITGNAFSGTKATVGVDNSCQLGF